MFLVLVIHLPGGNCDNYGYFYNFSDYGGWWSSSEINADDAWYRVLSNNRSRVSRNYYSKDRALSVRCIKD